MLCPCCTRRWPERAGAREVLEVEEEPIAMFLAVRLRKRLLEGKGTEGQKRMWAHRLEQ